MPLFSVDGLREDLADAEAVIRGETGVDPHPWFRCPFGTGADDEGLITSLAELGYRHAGWHVEAYEWDEESTAEGVGEAVVRGTLAHGDGAVVLLHPWPDQVAPALPPIVAALRDAGATFVRLDDLDLPPGLEPIGNPRPAATGATAG